MKQREAGSLVRQPRQTHQRSGLHASRFGILRDELEAAGELDTLLRDEKTGVLSLSLVLLGVDIVMDATLQLVRQGAEPRCYPSLARETGHEDMANIFITCTDNTKSRLTLWKILKQARKMHLYDRQKPLYWMDFGNGQTFGRVLRGTIPRKITQPHSEKYEPVSWLPVITEYTNYARVKAEDSGPSCSLAEALEKQDLFINSTLAQLGSNILWKMFRNGMIEYRGAYLNLDTMKVNPILV